MKRISELEYLVPNGTLYLSRHLWPMQFYRIRQLQLKYEQTIYNKLFKLNWPDVV